MKHGLAERTCGIDKDRQYGHAAWTYVQYVRHGNTEWTWSMDMQYGLATRTCSMDTQHRHAAWICSMDTNHRIQNGHATGGHAAWKRSRDLLTPYSRPLLFSLLKRFGLWVRVSSVVPQRAEKSRAFSFALSIYSLYSFSCSGAPLLLRAREREKSSGVHLCRLIYPSKLTRILPIEIFVACLKALCPCRQVSEGPMGKII
jgi:hypothetical protein